MNKDFFYENKRKMLWVINIIVAALIIFFAVQGIRYVLDNRTDSSVDEEIENLTYTEQNVQKEMDIMERYTEEMNLSDYTKGKLYKALAELSYMTGDDMLYNRYVATALLYLGENKDVNSVVYLTNKYMGRLYANGCYESAEQLLIGLEEKYKISEFPFDMQASYYLSRADLAQMLHSDDTVFLNSAKTTIGLQKDSNEKSLNQAKLDLLSSRSAMLSGDWDVAKFILDKYSEDDSFGYAKDQVYVICDFRIPYEELMAKLALHDNDVNNAKSRMEKYFELCEQYQFRAMELNLLSYANKQPVMQKSGSADEYIDMEKELLEKNLSEITNEYAQILLADMENTQEGIKQEKLTSQRHNRTIMIIVAVLIIILVASIIVSILIDYLERDGLTKLSNRKKYEKIRMECDKNKTPYGFLIIDIDDFKKVNDTYGHQQGDVVLSGIASILIKYTGRGIYAFRYGGEEMCMMFIKVSQKRTEEISKEIVQKISNTYFIEDRRITVSGGLAMSKNGENVFVEADQKLYKAKANGKNQIVM